MLSDAVACLLKPTVLSSVLDNEVAKRRLVGPVVLLVAFSSMSKSSQLGPYDPIVRYPVLEGAPREKERRGATVIPTGGHSTHETLGLCSPHETLTSVNPAVRTDLEASLVSAGSAFRIEQTAKERIYPLLPTVLRCKVQLLPLVRTIRGVTYAW